MRHLIKQLLMEQLHNRDEQARIALEAPVGTVLPEEYIYHYVYKLHGPYDFQEGDLGERIENYSHYKLKLIALKSIPLTYDYDKETVLDYRNRFKETGSYPPVVLESDLDIIDGTHRVRGLKSMKETHVKAWVGFNQ